VVGCRGARSRTRPPFRCGHLALCGTHSGTEKECALCGEPNRA
jgi:hypothetical protein